MKKTSGFLVLLLCTSVLAYTSPTEEVLCYQFNESSSPAVDCSGNGIDGIWNGGITSDVPGVSKSSGHWYDGTAYEFDGVDDYVEIGEPSELEPSNLGSSFGLGDPGLKRCSSRYDSIVCVKRAKSTIISL